MSINENSGAESANNETYAEPKKSFWQRTKEAFSAFFSLNTLRSFWNFLFVLFGGAVVGAAAGIAAGVAMYFFGPIAAAMVYLAVLFAIWTALQKYQWVVYNLQMNWMHLFDRFAMWLIVRREVKATEKAQAEEAKNDTGDNLGGAAAAA